MDFMRAGGVPMWIVLLFGLITLVVAGLFIWRPDQRRLGVLRGLSAATIFAILSGICSCLAAVMHNVTSNPKFANSPDIHLFVMIGLGESLAPAILGFTILALAWLMMGLGQRRLTAMQEA